MSAKKLSRAIDESVSNGADVASCFFLVLIGWNLLWKILQFFIFLLQRPRISDPSLKLPQLNQLPTTTFSTPISHIPSLIPPFPVPAYSLLRNTLILITLTTNPLIILIPISQMQSNSPNESRKNRCYDRNCKYHHFILCVFID